MIRSIGFRMIVSFTSGACSRLRQELEKVNTFWPCKPFSTHGANQLCSNLNAIFRKGNWLYFFKKSIAVFRIPWIFKYRFLNLLHQLSFFGRTSGMKRTEEPTILQRVLLSHNLYLQTSCKRYSTTPAIRLYLQPPLKLCLEGE